MADTLGASHLSFVYTEFVPILEIAYQATHVNLEVANLYASLMGMALRKLDQYLIYNLPGTAVWRWTINLQQQTDIETTTITYNIM